MRSTPLLIAALAVAPAAVAQTLRPQVRAVAPTGAQRGTTVTLSLTGPNLGYATAVVTETPGVTVESVKPDAPPAGAKNPDGRVAVTLRIAPDAPLGRHPLRVVTQKGVSEPAYVVVGAWPEAAEKEPNNRPAEAQPLAGPITVVGKMDGGEDVDVYKVSAKAGETVVLELLAGGMGSPMDPVVTVADAAGHDVATVERATRRDATQYFTAPKAGDYFVTVRDLRYQGGGDFHYRLTVGAIPFAVAAFPLGGGPGAPLKVDLEGVNLPAPRGQVAMPMATPFGGLRLPVNVGGPLTNLLSFEIGTDPESTEVEPNERPPFAQRVAPPVVVNGRVNGSLPGLPDTDYVKFKAVKGQLYDIEVFAARLGSRLDAVVAITDANGGERASNDDARGRDAALEWRAPDDADYFVRVTDLNGRSGPEFGYRLRIAPAQPDFRLEFYPDTLSVGAGDRRMVTVTAQRRFGFDGEIALDFGALPPGLSVVGAPRIVAGQNQAQVIVVAAPDAAAAAAPLSLVGRGRSGSREIARIAQPLQEDYAKNGDQLQRNTRPVPMPWASIYPAPDVVLNPAADKVEVGVGKTVELVVKIVRGPGMTGKVPLIAQGLPAGVSLVNPEIPENQSEHKLTIKAEGNAAVGAFPVILQARTLVDELRFTDHAALPITLTVSK